MEVFFRTFKSSESNVLFPKNLFGRKTIKEYLEPEALWLVWSE